MGGRGTDPPENFYGQRLGGKGAQERVDFHRGTLSDCVGLQQPKRSCLRLRLGCFSQSKRSCFEEPKRALGSVTNSMDLHWMQWNSMEFRWIAWNPMGFHGIPWKSMDSMEINGFPGGPLELESMESMEIHEINGINEIHGFHGIHGFPLNPWNLWIPWKSTRSMKSMESMDFH